MGVRLLSVSRYPPLAAWVQQVWNPNTGSAQLTSAQKAVTGLPDWNDDNMDLLAPLVYDSVQYPFLCPRSRLCRWHEGCAKTLSRRHGCPLLLQVFMIARALLTRCGGLTACNTVAGLRATLNAGLQSLNFSGITGTLDARQRMLSPVLYNVQSVSAEGRMTYVSLSLSAQLLLLVFPSHTRSQSVNQSKPRLNSLVDWFVITL